jgi:hypothetical protein
MAATGLGSFIQYAVMPPVLLLNRLQMAITAPEKYGVVAVGCELMQFWTTIEEDMLPIPVANHALAGSSSADLVSAVDFQVNLNVCLKESLPVFSLLKRTDGRRMFREAQTISTIVV